MRPLVSCIFGPTSPILDKRLNKTKIFPFLFEFHFTKSAGGFGSELGAWLLGSQLHLCKWFRHFLLLCAFLPPFFLFQNWRWPLKHQIMWFFQTTLVGGVKREHFFIIMELGGVNSSQSTWPCFKPHFCSFESCPWQQGAQCIWVFGPSLLKSTLKNASN